MIKHSKYLKEIGVDPMEGIVKKDPRYKMDKELGFAQFETWNLCYSLALEIYPRLCYLREIARGYPLGLNEKKWGKILDKMIKAFKLVLTGNRYRDEDLEAIEEGLSLFAKWYLSLWW